MTLKKKIFPLLVACSFIMSSFSFNLGIFAEKSDDSPISYVTEQKDVKSNVNSFVEDQSLEVKLNKFQGVSQINDDSKVLWIDYSLMKDNKTKDKLLSMYNKGCKIVIRNDNLTEQEILNYFGLDSKDLRFEDLKTMTELKRVGIFLQKREDGSFDVVALNSMNLTEPNIQDFMLYASKSKYMDRLRGKQDKQALLVDKNISYAEWIPVNYSAAYDSRILVNVNWSITLDKDSYNPTSGQYKSCNKSTVEVVPHSSPSNPGVQINNIHVWVDGGSQNGNWSSRNLSYTPMGNGSTDPSGQIYLTFPWGVQFAFNCGGRTVSYSTETGGIGYGYVQVLFNPSSPIKDARGSACVTTEAYQSTSFNSNPSYFVSTLKYFVNDQNYIARPNTYYTESSTHTISGY